MTDKQIACAFIERKLHWMIPDHNDLRDIAESRLSEDRCYRIIETINDMTDKMRQPLIDHLNRSGLDAV